jgi:hypothetical protein
MVILTTQSGRMIAGLASWLLADGKDVERAGHKQGSRRGRAAGATLRSWSRLR